MPSFHDNDPLYRMRHALAGMALALILSVLVAALLARGLGDLIADSYGLRVALYGGMLIHLVTGAAVLFMRVARHETRPLALGRVLLWLASLWLWPLLLLSRRRPPADAPGGPGGPSSTA